jgi:hypothetical protein
VCIYITQISSESSLLLATIDKYSLVFSTFPCLMEQCQNLKAQIHDRIKREKSTKYPTDPQAATAEH